MNLLPPGTLVHKLGSGIPAVKTLAAEARSGVLTARAAEGEVQVVFKRGRVAWARSGSPDDRLGGVLLRLDYIGLQQLAEATNTMLREGRRIGSILLESELLDAARLRRALSEQMIQIVSRALTWDWRDYEFGPGSGDDDGLAADIGVNYLIQRACDFTTSVPRLLADLGGTSGVFRRTESFAAELVDLVLDESEREVVVELAGEIGLLQLCKQTSAPDFQVCRFLWILVAIGAVERVD